MAVRHHRGVRLAARTCQCWLESCSQRAKHALSRFIAPKRLLLSGRHGAVLRAIVSRAPYTTSYEGMYIGWHLVTGLQVDQALPQAPSGGAPIPLAWVSLKPVCLTA